MLTRSPRLVPLGSLPDQGRGQRFWYKKRLFQSRGCFSGPNKTDLDGISILEGVSETFDSDTLVIPETRPLPAEWLTPPKPEPEKRLPVLTEGQTESLWFVKLTNGDVVVKRVYRGSWPKPLVSEGGLGVLPSDDAYAEWLGPATIGPWPAAAKPKPAADPQSRLASDDQTDDPCLTRDYRDAPSGIGPLADTWRDKPHRLIYALCNEIDWLRVAHIEKRYDRHSPEVWPLVYYLQNLLIFTDIAIALDKVFPHIDRSNGWSRQDVAAIINRDA